MCYHDDRNIAGRNIAGRRSFIFVKYFHFASTMCDLAIGVIADRQILRFFSYGHYLSRRDIMIDIGGPCVLMQFLKYLYLIVGLGRNIRKPALSLRWYLYFEEGNFDFSQN